MAPTKEIDRRFPGIGRVRIRSGTTHDRVYEKMNAMLTDLYEEGRLDLLRGIRDKRLVLLDVYDAYRSKDLGRLPTAESMMPLEKTFTAFAEEYECSEIHRVNLRQTLRYLMKGAPSGLTVGDLPRRLSQIRAEFKNRPRSFNLTRSHCQAFARKVLGSAHRVWIDLKAIDPYTVTPSGKKNPLTPEQFVSLISKLTAHKAAMCRTMALTGMGPKEYWGPWQIETDRVRIHGTKRRGRDRFVPYVGLLAAPTGSRQRLAIALARASGGMNTLYDFRRTYSNWMEAAGIPRTRRRLYMGHRGKDVTDEYEWHEVAAFLKEDAAKLTDYLKRSGGESLLSPTCLESVTPTERSND